MVKERNLCAFEFKLVSYNVTSSSSSLFTSEYLEIRFVKIFILRLEIISNMFKIMIFCNIQD